MSTPPSRHVKAVFGALLFAAIVFIARLLRFSNGEGFGSVNQTEDIAITAGVAVVFGVIYLYGTLKAENTPSAPIDSHAEVQEDTGHDIFTFIPYWTIVAMTVGLILGVLVVCLMECV